MKQVKVAALADESTYALASNAQRAILLSRTFYGAPARFLEQLRSDVEDGYHPPGTDHIEAALAHEWAHHLDWWLKRQTDKALLPYVSTDGIGLIAQTYTAWLKAHSGDSLPSQYARDFPDRESWPSGFESWRFTPASRWSAYVRAMDTLMAEINRTWVGSEGWDYVGRLDKAGREKAQQAINDLKQRLGIP